MSVHVSIDRVVIEGLPVKAAETRVLRSAMIAELERLLAEHGLGRSLSGGGAYVSVPAPIAPVPVSTDARELGTTLARAVYGGLGV
jgi:hypothetical protein